MAALTACKASSIHGRGNESQTGTALRVQKSIHKQI